MKPLIIIIMIKLLAMSLISCSLHSVWTKYRVRYLDTETTQIVVIPTGYKVGDTTLNEGHKAIILEIIKD